jgi:uncharacterized protein YciI
MPIFAVRYDYVDDEPGLDRERPAHQAFFRSLAAEGVLRASGPFGADGGQRGALLLVRARTADGARAALATDPFAVAGLIAEITVREWLVMTGPAAQAITAEA